MIAVGTWASRLQGKMRSLPAVTTVFVSFAPTIAERASTAQVVGREGKPPVTWVHVILCDRSLWAEVVDGHVGACLTDFAVPALSCAQLDEFPTGTPPDFGMPVYAVLSFSRGCCRACFLQCTSCIFMPARVEQINRCVEIHKLHSTSLSASSSLILSSRFFNCSVCSADIETPRIPSCFSTAL